MLDIELIAEHLVEETHHPLRRASWELGVDDVFNLAPSLAFIYHEGSRLVHLAASEEDRGRVLVPATGGDAHSYACLVQSQREGDDSTRDFAFLSGRTVAIGTMKVEEVPVVCAYELGWEEVDVIQMLVSFLRGEWTADCGMGVNPDSLSDKQRNWLESLGWIKPTPVVGRIYTMATLPMELAAYERHGTLCPADPEMEAVLARILARGQNCTCDRR